ncbi:hypothetical protein QBC38DRAFT_468625 [Podospora fimiseda]|uniref:RRM domain-containing protein n=1 Tax=Podospora fimiseda TaxID=252190 RepID=A0AAN7H0D0_9PEZI|nr:hypothetical protein QBC38DRAFT_468625 [Podospora fimiseda]
MQSFRRAALRSALSASRAVSVKAPTAPFASTIARAATVSSRVSFQSVRFYSEEPLERNDQGSVEIQEAAQETEVSLSEQAPTQISGSKPHAAFVRNLVFEVTEAHLKEAFEKYGPVREVYIVRDPRGLSKGFGFVTFESKESLDAACENVNGSFWHGRRITCIPRTYQTPKSENSRGAPANGNYAPREPTTQLFIGNIPYETTDAELNKIFADVPNLRDVRIAVDRTTGWPRGFAHADFADLESAKVAHAKLQGAQIGERVLRVDYADGYQKKRSNDSR